MCKFAYDTYLIIPASNEASRRTEIVNVQNWAKRNNLRLNCDKLCEVVLQSAGGGDGMLLSLHHCQELCAAAA